MLANPLSAEAHAIVIASQPTLDAHVGPGVVPVELRFNSRIDHKRSRLFLLDAQNNPARIVIDPESPVDRIKAVLSIRTPGAYRLRWQVLAVDGHITRGDIPFTIDRTAPVVSATSK